MFIDELSKIRESEDKAEQIQRDAKAEAKSMLEEARAKADKIIEDAEDGARDAYEKLMAKGQKESDKKYGDFLDKTRGETDDLISRAADKKSEAVDFIVERIVNSSVDS